MPVYRVFNEGGASASQKSVRESRRGRPIEIHAGLDQWKIDGHRAVGGGSIPSVCTNALCSIRDFAMIKLRGEDLRRAIHGFRSMDLDQSRAASYGSEPLLPC